MFSGITNQFSNLLGKGEGEQAADGTEGAPAPVAAVPDLQPTADAAVEGGEAGAEG